MERCNEKYYVISSVILATVIIFSAILTQTNKDVVISSDKSGLTVEKLESSSTVAEDTSSTTVEAEVPSTTDGTKKSNIATSSNKTTSLKNSNSTSDSSSAKTNAKSETSKATTTTTSPTITTCNHNWKLLSYTNGCYVYNCSKCDDYKSEEREMNPDDFMGSKSEYLELLGYVNQARREAGLNELVYIDELQAGADTRAQELTVSFSHTRPNGKHQSTVYENYKFTELHGKLFVSCQENAASGTTTAKATFNAWMNSEGHKKAILNENAYGFVASRCNRHWMMAVICCPTEG